ncbi:(4Fe-4S)-binding protein [Culicoidibacter larvae]|uniref:Divergent 4Fe-4S mono-cluster domain-containing protein n=1 Tax=Culicoidibacter larvae TaxID=2579976 RepID=A0A5R8QED9_9FIRM|nr:(4Fe-4S)-binding protein [Culicoidibacter larvae]TLG75390.1 hypothetical protein FEZ08_04900 [Culicoidibacter larvae]
MSQKQLSAAELMEKGFRKYSGEEIDVYFNLDTCMHSGHCVLGNRAIFNTDRRPWIAPDNADVEEVIRVVENCPSGALRYIRK